MARSDGDNPLTLTAESVIPDTILLGRIAIAAGRAGYTVTLVYHDFPAPLLTEIWKYHAEGVGEGQAVYIGSRGDLRLLAQCKNSAAKEPGNEGMPAKNPSRTARLVFVRDPRLLGEMAWAAELGRFGMAEQTIRPAVFAIAGAEDDVDAPGARLDAYASPEEEQKIVSWLQQVEKERQQVKKDLGDLQKTSETPVAVSFREPIDRLCWPRPLGSEAAGLSRLSDCQVLRALLAGACVLRNQQEPNADDYDTVYALLTGKLARPADERADALVVDMVGRTNEYLQMLHCEANALSARSDSASYRPRRVTRKILVDLGDTRSQAVRQLVRFLLKQTKNFQSFRKLGLLADWPQESDWQAIQRDIADKKPKEVNRLPGFRKLLAALQYWTEKQVRSRFHRQYKDGTIDGEKKGTGPWIYTVPETLVPGRSAFHNLPKPAVIRAALAAGANVPEPNTACPACPPLAQPAGQAQVQGQPSLTSETSPVAQISTK